MAQANKQNFVKKQFCKSQIFGGSDATNISKEMKTNAQYSTFKLRHKPNWLMRWQGHYSVKIEKL